MFVDRQKAIVSALVSERVFLCRASEEERVTNCLMRMNKWRTWETQGMAAVKVNCRQLWEFHPRSMMRMSEPDPQQGCFICSETGCPKTISPQRKSMLPSVTSSPQPGREKAAFLIRIRAWPWSTPCSGVGSGILHSGRPWRDALRGLCGFLFQITLTYKIRKCSVAFLSLWAPLWGMNDPHRHLKTSTFWKCLSYLNVTIKFISICQSWKLIEQLCFSLIIPG